MKYTYLLINLFTILVPFLFSFHPKIRFDKEWKYFWPAVILVAFVFVVWDALFTRLGVWSFNPVYISGIYILKLPLEEVLFFICIPYACVFTFHCINKFYSLNWNKGTERNFALLLSLFLILMGVVFRDRWYTMVCFISTGLLILTLVFILRINWFDKAVSVYAFLLIPFFIVNGLLTGTGLEQPVVLYNDAENLGIRILTIPVEDAFYGFELFLLNLFFFHWFSQKTFSIRTADKKYAVKTG